MKYAGMVWFSYKQKQQIVGSLLRCHRAGVIVGGFLS